MPEPAELCPQIRELTCLTAEKGMPHVRHGWKWRGVERWCPGVQEPTCDALECVLPLGHDESFHEDKNGMYWLVGDDASTALRPVEQCGASTGLFRLGVNPSHYLGPCVLRHDHDGPVHQDADGVQWAGTIGRTPPKPRQDVPDDLVDDAVDAWHNAPRNEHGKIPLDDHMRHVLAELLPILLPAYERAVRDHIAAEIEAACVDPDWPNDDISQNGQKAARIARGETR